MPHKQRKFKEKRNDFKQNKKCTHTKYRQTTLNMLVHSETTANREYYMEYFKSK